LEIGIMEERLTMGQAAKELGVTKNTLYLWEKNSKIDRARRLKRNNYRFYTREDLAKIRTWMEATEAPVSVQAAPVSLAGSARRG
jgi:DNA-binding transcriptional MerR regulator